MWGFTIYRCAYGDDAVWATCLERLDTSIQDYMLYYKGLGLLEEGCFQFTVFDNAKEFNGARTQLVREHFKEWRKQAVVEKGGSPEEIEVLRKNSEHVDLPYGVV